MTGHLNYFVGNVHCLIVYLVWKFAMITGLHTSRITIKAWLLVVIMMVLAFNSNEPSRLAILSLICFHKMVSFCLSEALGLD